VLVAVLPGLRHEDHLVDARLLVTAQVLADLVRRPDGAAQAADSVLNQLRAEALGVRGGGAYGLRVVAVLRAPPLVLGPDVGGAGVVSAEDVVVRERVAEEVRALEPAPQRLLFVRVAHEGRDAGDVRVDGVADRHAVALERGVVVRDPVARVLRIDEGERQRADALLRGQQDRVPPAARDPDGRVRLLARLRHDVARRHRDARPGVAREGRLRHAAECDAQPLLPERALLGGVDPEAAELGLRRRLAASELDTPARDEVERRQPLGHPGGVVEGSGRLHDAMAEAEPLRPLRHRSKEHLGRARVAVLLEEVVLHLPDAVEAEAVGELALLERLLHQLVLGVLVPGPGELVLVEETELHVAFLRLCTIAFG
jgi:hypothetical protein